MNRIVANHLDPSLKTTVETLLNRGMSQREIADKTGVDRRTIRRIQQSKYSGVATAGEVMAGQNTPPEPKTTPSKCEPFRTFIETQLDLGCNAVGIHQDLIRLYGFQANEYNSVKRFVRKLKTTDPKRFDKLEFLPGEEAQVDYGLGAPTRTPDGRKYKKPYLFCMTLKYSGRCFRRVVWKTSQEIWARLHIEAFQYFCGVPQYIVQDNLKEGVIRPDIYLPQLNALYAAMLQHYNTAADPCRVRDPNRKGSVENAIKHTQNTPLKGKRFESIEAQNEYLADWERDFADTRVHGTKKRVVMEMFKEEKPHLLPLPTMPFLFFREAVSTVDDYGCVIVDGSQYSALPARLHSQVSVRIFDDHIEIRSPDGSVSRTHRKAARKGSFVMSDDERVFNPTRDVQKLLEKVEQIGPQATRIGRVFAQCGRQGQRQLYGLSNLLKTYRREDIEAVAALAVAGNTYSYESIKNALEQRVGRDEARPKLTQSAPEIRDISEYQTFFDTHTAKAKTDDNDEK